MARNLINSVRLLSSSAWLLTRRATKNQKHILICAFSRLGSRRCYYGNLPLATFCRTSRKSNRTANRWFFHRSVLLSPCTLLRPSRFIVCNQSLANNVTSDTHTHKNRRLLIVLGAAVFNGISAYFTCGLLNTRIRYKQDIHASKSNWKMMQHSSINRHPIKRPPTRQWKARCLLDAHATNCDCILFLLNK